MNRGPTSPARAAGRAPAVPRPAAAHLVHVAVAVRARPLPAPAPPRQPPGAPPAQAAANQSGAGGGGRPNNYNAQGTHGDNWNADKNPGGDQHNSGGASDQQADTMFGPLPHPYPETTPPPPELHDGPVGVLGNPLAWPITMYIPAALYNGLATISSDMWNGGVFHPIRTPLTNKPPTLQEQQDDRQRHEDAKQRINRFHRSREIHGLPG